MARPTKETVEYFPHSCVSGKTIFIIENNFGNDGYCFWFKLLELLGSSEKHYYDCRNEESLEFLSAKTRLLPTLCLQILDKLAMLDAIDKTFWSKRIIFSENFVCNIEDAYDRRNLKPLHKLDLCNHLFGKCEHIEHINAVNDDINPQSRVKKSILKKSVWTHATQNGLVGSCKGFFEDETYITDQAKRFGVSETDIKIEINQMIEWYIAKDKDVGEWSKEKTEATLSIWFKKEKAFKYHAAS